MCPHGNTQALEGHHYRDRCEFPCIHITFWCLSLSCSAEIKTPYPAGGWWLHADPKHIDSKVTRTRRLMIKMLKTSPHPVASPPTNQEKVHELQPSPQMLLFRTSLKRPIGSFEHYLTPCLLPCNKCCGFLHHLGKKKGELPLEALCCSLCGSWVLIQLGISPVLQIV